MTLHELINVCGPNSHMAVINIIGSVEDKNFQLVFKGKTEDVIATVDIDYMRYKVDFINTELYEDLPFFIVIIKENHAE